MGYGFDVELTLQRIAVQKAHQEWEDRQKSSLWNQPETVRQQVIQETRKKTNEWFELLKPAYVTHQRNETIM